MPRKFLIREAGGDKQHSPVVLSEGVASAGEIPALDETGRLDESVMPLGIGADTTPAIASETLGAGKFVNYHNDGGVFSARLADNSNGRHADGFVLEEYAVGSTAIVYPLDGTNASLSGLTGAARYFLGTAGGVITPALDAAAPVNAGRICQYLGVAKSATELVTNDDSFVVL